MGDDELNQSVDGIGNHLDQHSMFHMETDEGGSRTLYSIPVT